VIRKIIKQSGDLEVKNNGKDPAKNYEVRLSSSLENVIA
jgi:hypothetical protein